MSREAAAAEHNHGGVTVREWLSVIGLSEYASTFEREGYDDLVVVSELEEEDLDALKITKKGTRKKLLLRAKQLKNALEKDPAVDLLQHLVQRMSQTVPAIPLLLDTTSSLTASTSALSSSRTTSSTLPPAATPFASGSAGVGSDGSGSPLMIAQQDVEPNVEECLLQEKEKRMKRVEQLAMALTSPRDIYSTSPSPSPRSISPRRGPPSAVPSSSSSPYTTIQPLRPKDEVEESKSATAGDTAQWQAQESNAMASNSNGTKCNYTHQSAHVTVRPPAQPTNDKEQSDKAVLSRQFSFRSVKDRWEKQSGSMPAVQSNASTNQSHLRSHSRASSVHTAGTPSITNPLPAAVEGRERKVLDTYEDSCGLAEVIPATFASSKVTEAKRKITSDGDGEAAGSVEAAFAESCWGKTGKRWDNGNSKPGVSNSRKSTTKQKSYKKDDSEHKPDTDEEQTELISGRGSRRSYQRSQEIEDKVEEEMRRIEEEIQAEKERRMRRVEELSNQLIASEQQGKKGTEKTTSDGRPPQLSQVDNEVSDGEEFESKVDQLASRMKAVVMTRMSNSGSSPAVAPAASDDGDALRRKFLQRMEERKRLHREKKEREARAREGAQQKELNQNDAMPPVDMSSSASTVGHDDGNGGGCVREIAGRGGKRCEKIVKETENNVDTLPAGDDHPETGQPSLKKTASKKKRKSQMKQASTKRASPPTPTALNGADSVHPMVQEKKGKTALHKHGATETKEGRMSFEPSQSSRRKDSHGTKANKKATRASMASSDGEDPCQQESKHRNNSKLTHTQSEQSLTTKKNSHHQRHNRRPHSEKGSSPAHAPQQRPPSLPPYSPVAASTSLLTPISPRNSSTTSKPKPVVGTAVDATATGSSSTVLGQADENDSADSAPNRRPVMSMWFI
ncbi:hypothetical protein QOT17_004519 [Balamuthia mandrillaris]